MTQQEISFQPWHISERLQTIAHYIPDHMRVADIGGDHAFLLIHVAKQERLQRGIVGEVNQGPFENARDRVALMGYESLIDVRLGDGLSVLSAGEVDVVVIAGMGGALISEILEAGKVKLTDVQRLILQPNIGAYRVRSWLLENQFTIVDETIVEEADILYEIIVAEPRDGETSDKDSLLSQEQLLELGPILWKKRHPLLKKKLMNDQAGRKKVLKQLEKARSLESLQRKAELEQEIGKWEKVITWLSEETN